MFHDFIGFEPAQKAVSSICHRANFTIRLMAPERHTGMICQVPRLVDIARPQAARVYLLQRHHIEGRHKLSDRIEILGPFRMRQNLTPAMCHVMMIAGGGSTRLDIETEQAKFFAFALTLAPGLFSRL
jgi:hypothetical protein